MAVTAVLLAAGYATRLYPLTKDCPKALLPLARGTILDAVTSSLPRIKGLRRTILVTNHRFAEAFREWQCTRNAKVLILNDGTESAETRFGAIRDLQLARNETDSRDDLLVVGTDNLFHWSLGEFVVKAQRHRPEPTVALWEAPSTKDATQFGVVVRDQASRITRFTEKSPEPPSQEVALCVYYFPAAMADKIQAFIQAGENCDAPGYFIQWLVRHGVVFGEMMPGAWYDIGTLEAYETVMKEWSRAT